MPSLILQLGRFSPRSLDTYDTTKVGKRYFNHSFIVPGLVAVITACLVGYPLAKMLI